MCAWLSAHYEFFKDFAGPTATFIAAFAALRVTARLGKGQLGVATQQEKIARQQAELADIRLKHDVFDRRFEVYEATRNFLRPIVINDTITNDEIAQYLKGTEKAVFLFDQEMVDHLHELYERANRLRTIMYQLGDHALSDEKRAELLPQHDELVDWFRGQYQIVVQRLKPFMALDKNTANRLPPLD
jgi:hypothetical protein